MPDHSQILDEQKISLAQSTRVLGTEDKPVHLSTALRAILKGIRTPSGDRIHLEALRVGGRWITSREAVERFASRLTAAALREPQQASAPPIHTSRQREKELDRVDRRLDAAGF
jgi:hypothetical protein